MPSNCLILCHPLLLFSSIFPSIRVFSNETALYIRWLKYWSFSFSISSSNKYSGWISFRMNWLDLLAVQGTLKCLQRNSLKASILWCSAFFTDILVYLYKSTRWLGSKEPTCHRVWSLSREDSLEKRMATHFSILAWKIPDRGAWQATVRGVTKSWTGLSRDWAHM